MRIVHRILSIRSYCLSTMYRIQYEKNNIIVERRFLEIIRPLGDDAKYIKSDWKKIGTTDNYNHAYKIIEGDIQQISQKIKKEVDI